MSALAVSFVLTMTALVGAPATINVNPDVVTPTAETTGVFRITDAGMYRVRVETDVDVECALADALRGRFTSYAPKCTHNVLLDPGVYKILLRFPQPSGTSKTGRAQVVVAPFIEDSPAPQKLDDGAEIETVLLEGHQRSFWIDVPSRQHVAFTVAGRTASAVRIWQEGKWTLKTNNLRRQTLTVRPGQSIVRWDHSGILEAGAYQVVVSSDAPVVWTTAKPRTRQNAAAVAQVEDVLFISRGAPPLVETGSSTFVIPRWGFTRFSIRAKNAVGSLLLDKVPTNAVELALRGTNADGSLNGNAAGCPLRKTATYTACGTSSVFAADTLIVEVTGDEGATGVVTTAPFTSASPQSGEAVRMNDNIEFIAPKDATREKSYLVNSFDLPPDDDAAPLSCVLEQLDPKSRNPIATVGFDAPHITKDRGIARSFNYSRRDGAGIWFNVDAAETYDIATSGGLATLCELFAVDERGKSTRVASGAPATKNAKMKNQCAISKFLSPGNYVLRLYNGRNGVENVKLATAKAKTLVPGKSSCQFVGVTLAPEGHYRLRHSRRGRGRARGITVETLPLKDQTVTLVATMGDRIALPVQGGGPLHITGVGGDFRCEVKNQPAIAATNGRCAFSTTATKDVLLLEATSPQSVTLRIRRRPPATPTAKRPTPYRVPSSPPLSSLVADKETFFDFARGQERAFLLTVPRSGIYEVETTGLLATRCTSRTPTVFSVFDDSQGGRGRNCLVQGGLRPGKYLFKVTAQGNSTGRAGVVLRTRTPTVAPAMTVGETRFEAVLAGTLVVTPFTVTDDDAKNPILIHHDILGADSNQCRLEDDDGWPVDQAPIPCHTVATLAPGRYRVMQSPSRLDFNRQIKIVPAPRQQAPQVPPPNQPLAFNVPQTVRLKDHGMQTFVFDVPTALDVKLSLDNGMRGVVYALRADGTRGREVTLLDPLVAQGPLPGGPFSLPKLQTRALRAGRYVFEVFHSRDDVGIVYTVGLGATLLAPGIRLEAPSDAVLPVQIPTAGYVRLQTDGPVDVRCRLFDATGRVVAESSHSGPDWNCTMLQRLDAGTYNLALELESGPPKMVGVSLTTPKTRDLSTIESNLRLRPNADMLTLTLPPTAEDLVEDVRLTSNAPLSCALEEREGRVLALQLDVTECRLLAWAGPRGDRAPLIVRVWQTAASDGVKYVRTQRQVTAFRGGTLDADEAGLSIVEKSGTFVTADGVMCLAATRRGALEGCSSAAALKEGAHIIAAVSDRSTSIPLTEHLRPEGTSVTTVGLGARALFERQQSKSPALHLAEVKARKGATAPPVCRLEAGVSRLVAQRCVAARNATTTSTLIAFAPSERAADVDILRRTVPLTTKEILAKGTSNTSWTGEALQLTLPKSAFRVRAALPVDGWAVLLGADDRVVDVCRPATDAPPGRAGPPALGECVLSGVDGTLVLVRPYGAPLGRARLELVTTPAAAAPRVLSPLQELGGGPANAQAFRIDAIDSLREIHVDSDAPVTCELFRDDGVRQQGCDLQLPAALGGEFVVDHSGAPLRARVHRPHWGKVATFGRSLPVALGQPLSTGETVPLKNGLNDRTVVVKERSLVRIASDSGVCAIFSGRRTLDASGLGGPCAASAIVDPGPLRVMVRPFANEVPRGGFVVEQTPVETIGEGVGPTAWILPGEARVFEFAVKDAAKVGLGLQVVTDGAQCRLYNAERQPLNIGCQQYLALPRGTYFFEVGVAPAQVPLAVRPVVLGINGTDAEIPESVLDALRAQAEVTP